MLSIEDRTAWKCVHYTALLFTYYHITVKKQTVFIILIIVILHFIFYVLYRFFVQYQDLIV